jgi:hypothetical protein
MSLLNAEEIPPPRLPRLLCPPRATRLVIPLALAVLVNSACAARVESSQTRSAAAETPAPAPTPAATKPEPAEIRIGDALVREDALTHEGYTVRRRGKRLGRGDAPGRAGNPEAAYAVLERGGKVLLRFDAGVYNGGLNSIGFGLFPFLGGASKQLIVSQDAPRQGRQWIVSLSPSPRVIYDGPAFAAGREVDDLHVADFDGDGVYELAAPLTTFYGFRDWALSPSATPLPEVVFRYDEKAGRYLPANARFRQQLLKDVEEAKSKVRGPAPPESPESHLSDILSVVLAHVFAGDERGGWEFYEKTYGLPDKAEVRRETEAELRAQPVYRFIYAKRAAR